MHAYTPSPEAQTPSLWLVSFADLTAILVAFFVLIYAMSLPVLSAHDGRVEGNRAASAGGGQIATAGQNGSGSAGRVTQGLSAELTLGYLSAVFADRNLAGRDGAGPVTQSMNMPRSALIIEIEATFLFDQNSSTIRPLAHALLEDLAGLLTQANNPVQVLVPVGTGGWAQAFDRADSVHGAFKAAGYALPLHRLVSPALTSDRIQLQIGQGEARS